MNEFGYLFLLLLQTRLLLLLVPCCRYAFWLPFAPAGADAFAAAAAEAFAAAAGPRMAKHYGSEGRRSSKIALRKCLT